MTFTRIKQQFFTVTAVVIFMLSCSKDDSSETDNSIFLESTETQLEIEALGVNENTDSKAEQNSSNIERGAFLGGVNGNPFDCSSYNFKESNNLLCAFDVYYAHTLPQEVIDCVRKEYFEAFPDLRLYRGFYISQGTHHERWTFDNGNDCGPTGGKSNPLKPKSDKDKRVCTGGTCTR